jgi:hypothetical protein
LTTALPTVNAHFQDQISNSCSCNTRISYYDENGVYFNGLDNTETYFALVARSETGSLFGTPSCPASPNAPSISRPLTSFSSDQIHRPNFTAHNSSSISADVDNAVPHSSENHNENCTVTPEEEGLPINGQQGSSATREYTNHNDIDLQSAFEEDATSWESWHATALHLLSSPAIPTTETSHLVCGSNMILRAADMLTLTAIIV